MAGQLPAIKTRQLLAALKQVGFRQVSQSGSHIKFRLDERIVIVPDHRGKDVPIGTLRAILNKAGLSVDQLQELL